MTYIITNIASDIIYNNCDNLKIDELFKLFILNNNIDKYQLISLVYETNIIITGYIDNTNNIYYKIINNINDNDNINLTFIKNENLILDLDTIFTNNILYKLSKCINTDYNSNGYRSSDINMNIFKDINILLDNINFVTKLNNFISYGKTFNYIFNDIIREYFNYDKYLKLNDEYYLFNNKFKYIEYDRDKHYRHEDRLISKIYRKNSKNNDYIFIENISILIYLVLDYYYIIRIDNLDEEDVYEYEDFDDCSEFGEFIIDYNLSLYKSFNNHKKINVDFSTSSNTKIINYLFNNISPNISKYDLLIIINNNKLIFIGFIDDKNYLNECYNYIEDFVDENEYKNEYNDHYYDSINLIEMIDNIFTSEIYDILINENNLEKLIDKIVISLNLINFNVIVEFYTNSITFESLLTIIISKILTYDKYNMIKKNIDINIDNYSIIYIADKMYNILYDIYYFNNINDDGDYNLKLNKKKDSDIKIFLQDFIKNLYKPKI